MQIITACRVTPERYQAGNYHLRLRPPLVCPFCRRWRCLLPHGYYERWVTDKTGRPIRIRIARLLCVRRGGTVSLLPEFAQPYRLVANATIQAYFLGRRQGMAVQRWLPILKRYWKRWLGWYKKLKEIVGSYFGRAPPEESASALLARALASCGTVAGLTKLLVESFQATCFGRYRCHVPGCAD